MGVLSAGRGGALAVLIAVYVGLAGAYHNGAPSSACRTGIPDHQRYTAQSTDCPFRITGYYDGHQVHITLAATTELYFEGFLVVGRVRGANTGSFTDLPSDSKTVACAPGVTGATHSNKEHRMKKELTWVPPADLTGIVNFRATFVKNISLFWTGQTTQVDLSVVMVMANETISESGSSRPAVAVWPVVLASAALTLGALTRGRPLH